MFPFLENALPSPIQTSFYSSSSSYAFTYQLILMYDFIKPLLLLCTYKVIPFLQRNVFRGFAHDSRSFHEYLHFASSFQPQPAALLARLSIRSFICELSLASFMKPYRFLLSSHIIGLLYKLHQMFHFRSRTKALENARHPER